MKVLVSITSYDRKEMLLELLDQLKGFDIVVWDDNSEFEIEGDFRFYKFYKNYGKKEAWRKFKRIFNYLLNDYSEYDYYFIIPDDVILCENFIKKALNLYKSIEDNNKICLSLLSDDRVKSPCWTDFEPIEKGDVILTQWSDLCFLCEKKFFEQVRNIEVKEDRWDNNPDLGSGVGSVISRLLYSNDYNQYHTKESLVKHIGYKSKMNKDHR